MFSWIITCFVTSLFHWCWVVGANSWEITSHLQSSMFKLYKNRNNTHDVCVGLCKQSDPLDDDRRRMPKKVERPFSQCIYVKVATLKIIKKLIQKIVRSMCHEFFTIFDNNFLIILSEATLSLESHTILYVIVMVNLYCFLGLKSRCFC